MIGLPIITMALLLVAGLRQPIMETLCMMVGRGEIRLMAPPPAKCPVFPKLIVCGPETPFALVIMARNEFGPVSFVVVTV